MGTEKRLIDANAFKSFLCKCCNILHSDEPCEPSDCNVWAVIDQQPTVDAVEVVHGWWIELPSMEPDYKCSECGRSYAWWEPSEAHYCPSCGAKMDLKGE